MTSDLNLDRERCANNIGAGVTENPKIPRIIVAATFVAEPLEAPFAWLLGEIGLRHDIEFSPYNQIFQELLTPSSKLAANSSGLNVLLIRLEDYIRDTKASDEAAPGLAQVAYELGDAIVKFADRITGSLVVHVFAPSPDLPTDVTVTVVMNSRALAGRIVGHANVHVLKDEEIELVAGSNRYDKTRDRLAHIPYTDSHYSALALSIARKIHAILVPAAKVLVLDCDNTLWQGVVGEDGIDGIQISPSFASLQDYAVAQQEKGILICLASKNIESDVMDVLASRSDMRLKLHHIVAHRVNWLPKTTNIRSLAEELSLGLDSFVFLDDNPVECQQVQAELPEVVTIQVPPAAEIPNIIKHLWIFDKLTTTSEDANRTRMYKENSARRVMESTATDINTFISALAIKIDIGEPADDEWTRVEQLTQKTNQFNFTTRRRTAAELKHLATNGTLVLRVRVADRFGDYGIVGVIVAQSNGTELLLDTFLLSCRVLGRGVEHAMVRMLGERAVMMKLDTVTLPFVATSRNIPARAFAENIAAEFATTNDMGSLYRIPASRASCIEHKPGEDPPEITDARRSDERKSVESTAMETPITARSARYSRFATELNSGEAVLSVMSARGRRMRQASTTLIAPETQLEAELLSLWEEVLEAEGLGVEDDYFASGGTSLLSVKLFSEIQRRFGAELRLTAILEGSTVRSLARLIASATTQERNGLVCLKPGGDRNLFLVHDGFGETLLYLNLAKRLPASISVYGIEPRQVRGIPLAHTSIEEMARFYVGQIQKMQPHGPYLLGGMCAGGVIAYEMAAQLTAKGEVVEAVTILDGAAPQAKKRLGRITANRISRLENLFAQGRITGKNNIGNWLTICVELCQKIRNVIKYEATSRLQIVSVHLRVALLKFLVRRGTSWPRWAPELNVMQIYNALELHYIPPRLPNVPVLLVRASSGHGSDTPYKDIYLDEDFGWRRVANNLELVDVLGGHSSMLQERAIDSLSRALLVRLARSSTAMPEVAQ